MANLINTYAIGKWAQWCTLSAGSDALLLALLQTTNLKGDATLRNYANWGALLADGNVECNFTNYAQKNLNTAAITITPSTTAFSQSLGIVNQTWSAAGGVANNVIGKGVLIYKPTSGATNNQTLIVATYDVSSVSTSSSDLLVSFAAATAAKGTAS